MVLHLDLSSKGVYFRKQIMISPMPIHPFVSRNAEVACRQDQQAITSMGVKAEREPCLVSFFHYQFSIFFPREKTVIFTFIFHAVMVSWKVAFVKLNEYFICVPGRLEIRSECANLFPLA